MIATASSQDPHPTTRDEPFLLVGNPTSHSGKAAERIEAARRELTRVGAIHDFRATLPHGGTVELVRRAIVHEGFRNIIYLGGDGTFHEVAKGVCQSGVAHQVRMGLLPSGTANDQGKSFGLSAHPDALARNIEVILAGHETRLDVGEVEAIAADGRLLCRELFFDSLAWGLSAAILASRNRELDIVRKLPVVREIYRDHAVYIRAAVQEMTRGALRKDRFTAELTVDGEVTVFDRVTDLIVSNTPIYAGEWLLAADARHDDGQMEICAMRGNADWTSRLIVNHKRARIPSEVIGRVPLPPGMLPVGQDVHVPDILDRLGLPIVPTLRGARFQVEILRPDRDASPPAEIDGEELPAADTFRVAVLPRLLRLIVPENFHWI